MLTESDNLRYAAHLPLKGVGPVGQARIQAARIALIGVGGLGCATAQYLVSSGIGELTLCDFDCVSESNLSRQVLYNSADIGCKKVEVSTRVLHILNPETKLNTIADRMTEADMNRLFPDCDFVVDASDNYGTRLAVNRAAMLQKTPWLMASCIRQEAQLLLLRPDLPDQPCYRCVYGEAPETLEDCPGAGIFAPVAGIAGTSAAYFALACVLGLATPPGLQLFDATHWTWQHLKISKNPACRDCS